MLLPTYSFLMVIVAAVVGQSSEGVIVVRPDVITSEPAVVISQGTVIGSLSEDERFYEFYGIPYADSTSGPNRFKQPRPPPMFHDMFIANRKNIKCVRALGAGYEGIEDCLVANVFTNTLNSSSQLPVMVWVKGREFDVTYYNEPSFKNFVENDVVVVSLNFRESVLGFLCLGTKTAPGNAGLKDIIAGLRWIQDNIAQFGGNPNSVTIVGHGSGAAAVDLVTLSPMANGLVHKAISQSGNALSPWAVSRDNIIYAIQVAEALGHIITDIEELSEIFERTSVAALMGVINELDLTDNSLAFSPCLERDDLQGVEPFMVKSPYQIITDNDFVPIPFITGYVDHEGTIRSKEAKEEDWLNRMNESFTDFIQADLTFENDQQEAETTKSIRSFYFHDEPIDVNQFENYIDYHGDTMILVSTIREVRMRVVASTAPVYMYQFSYKGNLGEQFIGPIKADGAAHSEELAYLFYDPNDITVSERDQIIGDILVERWTNFVRVGQPLSEISTISWRPFTAMNSYFLRILDNEEINDQAAFEILLQNPHPSIMTFWDQIYEKHFLDAEGKWDWIEKNEEEEDETENSGEVDENGSGDVDSETSGEVNGSDSGEDDGENSQEIGVEGGDSTEDSENNSGEDNDKDENGDSSASSAIGYTFSIITLFTVLNYCHSLIILS